MTEEQLKAMESSAPLLVAEYRKLREQNDKRLRDVAASLTLLLLDADVDYAVIARAIAEFSR